MAGIFHQQFRSVSSQAVCSGLTQHMKKGHITVSASDDKKEFIHMFWCCQLTTMYNINNTYLKRTLLYYVYASWLSPISPPCPMSLWSICIAICCGPWLASGEIAIQFLFCKWSWKWIAQRMDRKLRAIPVSFQMLIVNYRLQEEKGKDLAHISIYQSSPQLSSSSKQ